MGILTDIVMGGLVTGLLYVLVALGFNLIFGIMDVINFAHGFLVMWGGYLMWVFTVEFQLNFVIGALLAALVVGVGGVLLERGLFRRVVGLPFASLVIALGLGMILQNIALLIFGADPLAVPFPAQGTVSLLGAAIPIQRLIVAGIAIVALLGVYIFLTRTNQGRALRAVAQDPEVAELQGIPRGRMYALAFGAGALLAGLAGALLGPLLSVNLGMGDSPLLKAFVVVVIGGLGSIAGTAVAGLLIGLLGSVATFAVGSGAADLVAFSVMFLFLLLRPQGIFGRVGERV
jgi:branched-chain amino acid transport system permease protein